MKYFYPIILGFLIVACSTSQSAYYRKIVFAKYPKAIMQRKDLPKGSIELDTTDTKWDGKRLIMRRTHDFNEGEKMMIVWIATFDYENNETQENILNYDLLGDSIKYIDTSYYATIGEIKRYEIEGNKFEIIKRPNVPNKAGKPNGYNFISKQHGWLASQIMDTNTVLVGYEKRQLSKSEELLIDTLIKDKSFFTLK